MHHRMLLQSLLPGTALVRVASRLLISQCHPDTSATSTLLTHSCAPGTAPMRLASHLLIAHAILIRALSSLLTHSCAPGRPVDASQHTVLVWDG